MELRTLLRTKISLIKKIKLKTQQTFTGSHTKKCIFKKHEYK